ncbi:MAG TPA: hypothetical protein VN647_10130 [Nitrospira sp.]|nr:hypothetical protein [Nitrospira sp.]
MNGCMVDPGKASDLRVGRCLAHRQNDSIVALSGGKSLGLERHGPSDDDPPGTSFFHARRSFPTHAAKSTTHRTIPAQVDRRMCRYPTKRREAVERSDFPIMDKTSAIVAVTGG